MKEPCNVVRILKEYKKTSECVLCEFQRLPVWADISQDPSPWRLYGGLHCAEETGHLHGPLSIVPFTPRKPPTHKPKEHTTAGIITHVHKQKNIFSFPASYCVYSLQVTLSYGVFENKMNSIEVKGSFSKEEDPSRFVFSFL